MTRWNARVMSGAVLTYRLTWPIVLAAFNMLPKDPQREVALALLNEFT